MADYTPAEQKEHRRLWVEALRSGKYQQGRNRLRSGDTFCCLGVGCDVSGLGHWSDSNALVIDGEVAGAIAMPRLVRDYFGIAQPEGGFKDGGLTYSNDTLRATFAEIADIIEREPEGLIATPTDAVLP